MESTGPKATCYSGSRQKERPILDRTQADQNPLDEADYNAG